MPDSVKIALLACIPPLLVLHRSLLVFHAGLELILRAPAQVLALTVPLGHFQRSLAVRYSLPAKLVGLALGPTLARLLATNAAQGRSQLASRQPVVQLACHV